MKPKSFFFSLPVAALIFLLVSGCGGGGSDGGSSSLQLPDNTSDLSLTKTVDVTAPDIGAVVEFTITVSNAGPSNATSVIVNDQLPSGFTYINDSGGGVYSPATGVWSVGTVAVGGSQALNITAMVNETGNYTNIAEVTAANDSTPNNNTAGVAVPPPSIKVSINQIQTDCSTTPGKTEVKAFVTVVDQIGDPVTTLTKNQVTVSENNDKLTPDQFDMKFVNAIPLSVAIVLDYSTSIFDSGADIAMKDAAIAFINQLSAIDRAAIIKFGLSVQVIQPFTSDKDALRDAVRSPFVPERGTEIYKAILKGLEVTAEEDSGNRKAVAIITDGRQYPNPSTSGLTIDDVLFAAEADSIPIFPIGLGSRIDTEVLATLALESGGIFYQSIVSEDLREIYQQLADALIINQFVFTYTSDLTGGVNLTIGADYNGLTDSDTRQFTTCP